MAVDNLSFIGVGRFRGYWNASTNSGTLTADGGYDSDRASGVPLLNTGSVYGYASSSIGAFHTASSGGGAALTASAGDYFQVSVGAPTVVDSENGWEANDYILLKSGSSGEEFKWIRLSYTDTVSSVIQGGLNSSSLADELLELSGVGYALTNGFVRVEKIILIIGLPNKAKLCVGVAMCRSISHA